MLARKTFILFAVRVGQQVHQGVACDAEVGHGHPGQKTADGEPYSIPFRTEIVHGKRYGYKTDDNGKCFGNKRCRRGQTGPAITLAPGIPVPFGEKGF